MPSVRFDDFSGGASQNSPYKLLPTQSARMLNWYPRGKDLKRRKGIQALTSEAGPDSLLEMEVSQEISTAGAVGRRYLVFGSESALLSYDVERRKWVTLIGPDIPSSDTLVWSLRKYRGYVFGMRRGSGLRITGSPFTRQRYAGLGPPQASGVTLAEVAGTLIEGTYEYVFTFRNSETGEESLQSGYLANCRITTSAADKFVDISGIPQPPAGVGIVCAADQIRIWRSLVIPAGSEIPVGAIGGWRWLATVPVGTATYEDRTPQTGLGDEIDIVGGLPPNGSHFEIAKDRGWIASDGFVYWSQPGKPWSYYWTDWLAITPDDNEKVTGIHFYDSMDAVLVTKPSRIVAILSDGSGGFLPQEFSGKIGCVSARSMKSIGGELLWFGGDNFYRSHNGEPPLPISTARLRDSIEAIDQEGWDQVTAVIDPAESHYIVRLPTGEIWVYNWLQDWWAERGSSLSLRLLREVTDENFGHQIYAVGEDDHVYRTNHGEFDLSGDGTKYDIQCIWRSRYIESEKGAFVARRLGLACSSIPNVGTIRVLANDGQEDSESEVPLNQTMHSGIPGRASRFKAYSLPPNDASQFIAVEIEHSGRTALDIDSIDLELAERPGRIGVAM